MWWIALGAVAIIALLLRFKPWASANSTDDVANTSLRNAVTTAGGTPTRFDTVGLLRELITTWGGTPNYYDATNLLRQAITVAGGTPTQFQQAALLRQLITTLGGTPATYSMDKLYQQLSLLASLSPAGAPHVSTVPVISGTTEPGQTLTTTDGVWTNTPTGFAYQWYRNGVAISGATANTYTLVTADNGTYITVRVAATNASGTGFSTSAQAGPIAGTAPAFTSGPTISGTAAVGQTLTASGSASGTTPVTFTYQWLRNGLPIGGATASTYALVNADYAATISCSVTATNAISSVTATSNTLGAVTAVAPSNSVAPAITGTGTVGQVLTCSQGTWSGTATITYAYQWKRDGISISGATASTYTLVSADNGTTTSCTVTATNVTGGVVAGSNVVGPIGSSGMSAGTIAFAASHVAGDNPPAIDITLPSDSTVAAGDWYRFEYAGNSGFTSSTFTAWHQISSDDYINSVDNGGFIYSWGAILPGGATWFRLFFGRSADGTTFSLTSPASNVLTDTLTSSGALAKLDSNAAHTTLRPSGGTFSNGDLTYQGAAIGGGIWKVAATTNTTAPAGTPFQMEININTLNTVFAGADAFGFGIYDGSGPSFNGAFAGNPGENNSAGVFIKFDNNSTNCQVGDYRNGGLIGNATLAGVIATTDKFTLEIQVGGTAGADYYKVYRNGTLMLSRTGLTLSSTFKLGFVAIKENGKLTWVPGPPFTKTPAGGVQMYG